jgi:sugar O-acyltransferase (sialic acid O-acetyltransferase NeuD family)
VADHFVVEVPLVNPNEPEAMVVDVAVADGAAVSEGDLLCALETSKSVEDLYAEVAGYVFGLVSKLGTTVAAGAVLCYIAESPDWSPPESVPEDDVDPLPDDLKITDPALAVARDLDVDLATLPRGILVTERQVREAAGRADSPGELPPADGKSVIVYGAGGHAKTLIELIRAVGDLEPVGVVDDAAVGGSDFLGVPLIGSRQDLDTIRHGGVGLAVNAIGGITNLNTRLEATQILTQAGFELPALVHPSAVVEASARIGAGAQILAHAYVGSHAEVGEGTIVNTGAVVSHDCVLGHHVNLSPGCLLAGGIIVGDRTLLGMAVTTYLGIRIGADVRAGNGAIVNADVPDRRKISAGSSWDAGAAGATEH